MPRASRNEATVEEVVRQFSGLSSDDIITIALENESETFKIQKALLCTASEYFVKALQDGFKEGEHHKLILPDADIGSVRLFIYWLSKHKLPDMCEEADSYTTGSQEMHAVVLEKQTALVRLWCFGDRFFVPKLQNEAMVQLLRLLDHYYIRTEVVDLAFRSTSEASILRVLLMRSFLYNYGRPRSDHGTLKYGKENLRHLENTPGLMPLFLELLSDAVCNEFPCRCEESCYGIEQDYGDVEDDTDDGDEDEDDYENGEYVPIHQYMVPV